MRTGLFCNGPRENEKHRQNDFLPTLIILVGIGSSDEGRGIPEEGSLEGKGQAKAGRGFLKF